MCRPERVGAAHSLLERHLWGHIRISVHARKAKVWNWSGVFPPACVALQHAAKLGCPTAIVWRRDSRLSAHQQGFKVLVVHFGHPDFVRRFLECKIADHSVLLERIPEVPDTQSAWLLLSFCAAARANFLLRRVNPDHAEQFAAAHDHGVWHCFSRILQIFPIVGLKSNRRCRCGRAGLDFGVHVVLSRQPTGQAGQTNSKWRRSAIRP